MKYINNFQTLIFLIFLIFFNVRAQSDDSSSIVSLECDEFDNISAQRWFKGSQKVFLRIFQNDLPVTKIEFKRISNSELDDPYKVKIHSAAIASKSSDFYYSFSSGPFNNGNYHCRDTSKQHNGHEIIHDCYTGYSMIDINRFEPDVSISRETLDISHYGRKKASCKIIPNREYDDLFFKHKESFKKITESIRLAEIEKKIRNEEEIKKRKEKLKI